MKTSDRLELNAEDFNNALKEFNSYIDVSLEDLLQINQLAQKHSQLRQTEQLHVSDIMSRDVTTVTADTSLRDAARLLLEMRISGLPVVDAQHTLIGVVTEADFLAAMGIPSHHPAHNLWQTLETMFRHKPVAMTVPDKVGDIMSPEIITLHADNNLHDVIETMKQHHIKRVVITDEQQKVQGIITRSNLVRVLLQQML